MFLALLALRELITVRNLLYWFILSVSEPNETDFPCAFACANSCTKSSMMLKLVARLAEASCDVLHATRDGCHGIVKL